MSHDLLAATVPLPEKRLLASTRRAVASGLLVTAGDGYAFGHALIRQVLYAHLLPGERRHLHRRLAEALALCERTPIPASLPSTGTWRAALTGPLPRPSWRRVRRCRRMHTRRPSVTTP